MATFLGETGLASFIGAKDEGWWQLEL